ncbi:hypothetical protein [Microbacterium sp. KR10-403]|uniref:hypothetical protein n=1 Tax=Microbacterium sp. KR10-403 TaxID=3158581 RepID=UPI0032E47263
MRSGAIARFAGITAYGDVFHGAGFHLVDLSGWTDAPDVDMEKLARPTSHGQFLAPAYARARDVQMSGFHVADSVTSMEYESAALRGLFARVVRLTIEEPRGTFWVDGTVDVATYANRGFASEGDWLVNVHCVDPRKYGELRTFTGTTVQVFQYGNFPASPVIEVTGSMPSGYMVASQGRQFVVNQALSSGQTHRIDLARGWLYRGSTLQSGAVDVAESFTVPGGEKPVSVVLTPVSGSGQMTVKVTDTYI